MEPYSDDPPQRMMVIEQDDLNEVTYKAYTSGSSACHHRIGTAD